MEEDFGFELNFLFSAWRVRGMASEGGTAFGSFF